MKKVQFKTYSPKQSEIKPEWVLVDVKGKVLGRVANKIADLLRGKGKTIFSNHIETGDYVVVINAAEVKLTGKKETDKVYNWHTRYPNGLKAITPEKLRQEKPEEIIEHAVAGMLPNNKHKKTLLKKLKVFAGSEHEHAAQNPKSIAL
jgi:large subunit ribosomal protein L13